MQLPSDVHLRDKGRREEEGKRKEGREGNEVGEPAQSRGFLEIRRAFRKWGSMSPPLPVSTVMIFGLSGGRIIKTSENLMEEQTPTPETASLLRHNRLWQLYL